MATEHLSDEQIDRHVLQAVAMKALTFVLAVLGFLAAFMFNKLFADIDMMHERIHQLEIRVGTEEVRDGP